MSEKKNTLLWWRFFINIIIILLLMPFICRKIIAPLQTRRKTLRLFCTTERYDTISESIFEASPRNVAYISRLESLLMPARAPVDIICWDKLISQYFRARPCLR